MLSVQSYLNISCIVYIDCAPQYRLSEKVIRRRYSLFVDFQRVALPQDASRIMGLDWTDDALLEDFARQKARYIHL